MKHTNDILLSVDDLRVYFRSEDEVARAVDGISFDVRREETVCLVGESGCGKTVSALSIMRLVPMPPGEIVGGRILFNGQNIVECDEAAMELPATCRGGSDALELVVRGEPVDTNIPELVEL